MAIYDEIMTTFVNNPVAALDSVRLALENVSKVLATNLIPPQPIASPQSVMPKEGEIIDKWSTHYNPGKGIYQDSFVPNFGEAISPTRDPSFPFIYDPSTDEYLGFRWDYGDMGPLVPALTNEVLQNIENLYLSNSPEDYYCLHGSGWDRRLTVVFFKQPQTYVVQGLERNSLHRSMNRLLKLSPYVAEKESSGEYWPVQLHPQAQSLKDVGYTALLHPSAEGLDPLELLLLDPKSTVTRTLWYEWKPTTKVTHF